MEITLQYIKNIPTTIEKTKEYMEWISGIHESILRSYHTLRLVRDMIKRWDSVETIEMVCDFLND